MTINARQASILTAVASHSPSPTVGIVFERGQVSCDQDERRTFGERDQAAAKLDAAGDKAASGWDEFKKDVDGAFDKIEREFDEATK